MRKELLNEIKWILDDKTINEVREKGRTNVKVHDLKEMTKKEIKATDEILEDIKNKNYTLHKEVIDTLRKNGTTRKSVLNELLEELNKYNDDEVLEFRGC